MVLMVLMVDYMGTVDLGMTKNRDLVTCTGP